MLSSVCLLWCCISYVLSQSSLEFVVEPQDIIVRQGDSAVLDCQVNTSSPQLIIQWYKGKEGWINDYINKPYTMLYNMSLYFPNVTKYIEDDYKCAAILDKTQQRAYSRTAHIQLAYIEQQFQRSPTGVRVREFNQVLLTCLSGASLPLPTVHWEKNGRPLAIGDYNTQQHHLPAINATTASLQLSNVTLSDAGYYTCVATNPMLLDMPRTSQRALVLVLPIDDKPRIEVHPVNRVSAINQPFSMDCVIVGVPPPTIYWTHGGSNVTNATDGSTVVFPNGTLKISSLALKHNGIYSCVGYNDKGTVKSTSISIIVAYISYIFKQNPINSTILNGTKFQLTCEPPDHAPINAVSFKWYKNYHTIPKGGSGRITISPTGSLVFNPVLQLDTGNYLCEATNTFIGQIRTSNIAYLTVHVPPHFLSTPISQIVILNQQLRLTCVAGGSPSPVISWFHGNLLLSNSSRLTISEDGRHLSVDNVESRDAGVYQCLIRNTVGNKTADAHITVYLPPNVTLVPSNSSAVVGAEVTFSCQFSGNPPPNVTWSFSTVRQGNYQLLSDPTRFIQTRSHLRILNVTEGDRGWYNCTANNVAGFQSHAAHLAVFVPARLTDTLRNLTVNESDTVRLTCGSYGNPEPTITWRKEGVLLVHGGRIVIKSCEVQIRSVVMGDTGVYTCIARNTFGNESSSCHVTVQVSPTIHSIIGPSRVQWKNDVTLHCKANGVPKARIAWLKNGDSIPSSERISSSGDQLVIAAAGNTHTANYTCVATNVVGFAKMDWELIVEVPPDPPFNLVAHNRSSTSIYVVWSVGFNGYSPITSFRVETKRGSEDWTNVTDSPIVLPGYNIRYLRPYSEYLVRAYARNKVDWSSASAQLTAVTEQDAPSNPIDVSCVGHNSSSVYLTWAEPLQANGVLSQYTVAYRKHGTTLEYSEKSLMLHYFVSELDVYTMYDFRVQASTKNGTLFGNFSTYISCRTNESAPSVAPKSITLKAVSYDVLLVKWDLIPTSLANGVIRSYHVQYRTAMGSYREIRVSGNETATCNITGLRPWTVYEVRVAAFTVQKGPWSAVMSSKTSEAAPSGPPTNISSTAVSSSSMLVSWSAPQTSQRNGVIKGYTVTYKSDKLGDPHLNVTTNDTEVIISGLSIYTLYVVKVLAYTVVGPGPSSAPVERRTLESYPGPVQEVSVNILNNSILVTWSPPLVPNGIITEYSVHYISSIAFIVRVPGTNTTTVAITTTTRNITSDSTRLLIDGIVGNVTHLLCVAARTSVGFGKCSQTISFKTNFTTAIIPSISPTTPVFLPSIVDDHLPIIAGVSTVAAVVIIVAAVCILTGRRRRRQEEEKAKRTYDFRSHALSMTSYGGSSVASRGPINGYFVEDTGSVASRTNTTSEALTSGYNKPSLGTLRNTPLYLESDASSYDDAYSSVDEIGMNASRYQSTQQKHSAVNPLYADLHRDSITEDSPTNSYYAVNPIYDSTSPRRPTYRPPTPPVAPTSFLNPQRVDTPDSRETDPYEKLVLPPPPSFSPAPVDYDTNGSDMLYAYDNEVTDF